MSREKVLVITGGSKGIGRAIVDAFIREGFRVFAASRTMQDLEQMKGVHAFCADLSIKEEVLGFCNWVKEQTSHVDVLINNVGIYLPGSIVGESEDVFETQMAINLNCTYYMCKQIVPLMTDSQKPHVFNICSTANITPYPNGASYCISKYAQYGLTKVLREELKSKRIKVTAVLPGATLTSSWEGTELPASRFIDPITVAQLILTSYKVEDFSVMEEILIRPLEGDIT